MGNKIHCVVGIIVFNGTVLAIKLQRLGFAVDCDAFLLFFNLYRLLCTLIVEMTAVSANGPRRRACLEIMCLLLYMSIPTTFFVFSVFT
ncbi:MAG: hypothetical protein HY646_12450 [Acidobacteria bacterium]|nr:hypothetical protein [Acidobacteriota bacterium]